MIYEHHYDLCICTHLYPALALTELKKEEPIPFLFVATDYKCIPFTNEVNPDYFIIPSNDLKDDYLNMRIKEEKLVPLGIPVPYYQFDKQKLKESLKVEYAKNILNSKRTLTFYGLRNWFICDMRKQYKIV